MFLQDPLNFDLTGIKNPVVNPYYEQASFYILHWTNPNPYIINQSAKRVQNSPQGLFKIGFTTRPLLTRIDEIKKRWNITDDSIKLVGYIYFTTESKAREFETNEKHALKEFQVTLFDNSQKFATEWFLKERFTRMYLSNQCRNHYKDWAKIHEDKLFIEMVSFIDRPRKWPEGGLTDDENHALVIQSAMKKVGAQSLTEFIIMYACEA